VPEFYAIYRSDHYNDWFRRDYADTNFYVDDSVCGSGIDYHSYMVTALYINGYDTCESGFSNEAYEICIGLDETKTEPSIKIYPNPASDVLFIESSEKIESVSIYDCRGITMEQWNNGTMERWNGGTVEIPVIGLAPGLYLVKVETKGETVVRKVVIRW
jgi:hypothetical protein